MSAPGAPVTAEAGNALVCSARLAAGNWGQLRGGRGGGVELDNQREGDVAIQPASIGRPPLL